MSDIGADLQAAYEEGYEAGLKTKQRTGHWIYKNRLCGSIKHYEGTDEVTGEPRKIWVDDRVYADMPYCSECGSLAGDTSLNYCCVCGAKMVESKESEGV